MHLARSGHTNSLRPQVHAPIAPALARSNRKLLATPLQAAGREGSSTGGSGGGGGDTSSLLTSASIFAMWGALMYYVLVLAPNQTPFRDSYFVEKLLFLGVDDGVKINAVFTQLWNMMGLWPAIYSALLVPSGRSGNKVPAWPFITASFALGMYAMLPYFALWTAPEDEVVGPVPPPQESMQGWGKFGQQAAESPITAALLLIGAVSCLFQAATVSGASWADYERLFQESRLVHATSIDFLLFTGFIPFWMYNDASRRDWGPRDIAVPLLSLLPVAGPALYLCLRPRAPKAE